MSTGEVAGVLPGQGDELGSAAHLLPPTGTSSLLLSLTHALTHTLCDVGHVLAHAQLSESVFCNRAVAL